MVRQKQKSKSSKVCVIMGMHVAIEHFSSFSLRNILSLIEIIHTYKCRVYDPSINVYFSKIYTIIINSQLCKVQKACENPSLTRMGTRLSFIFFSVSGYLRVHQ